MSAPPPKLRSDWVDAALQDTRATRTRQLNPEKTRRAKTFFRRPFFFQDLAAAAQFTKMNIGI